MICQHNAGDDGGDCDGGDDCHHYQHHTRNAVPVILVPDLHHESVHAILLAVNQQLSIHHSMSGHLAEGTRPPLHGWVY